MTNNTELKAFYSLQEVVNFLLGEGHLAGYWFGEKPTYETGNFWWRKHLRAALSTEAHQEVTGAVARVDDLERGGRVRALALGLGLDTPLYTALPDAGFAAGMMKAAEICDEVEAENKQIGAAQHDAMADGAHNCAYVIRDAIRALMESPHPTVESPTNE